MTIRKLLAKLSRLITYLILIMTYHVAANAIAQKGIVFCFVPHPSAKHKQNFHYKLEQRYDLLLVGTDWNALWADENNKKDLKDDVMSQINDWFYTGIKQLSSHASEPDNGVEMRALKA